MMIEKALMYLDTIEKASIKGRLLRQDIPSWYRLNHSVTPNVYRPTIISHRNGRKYLVFRTIRTIHAGEELTFDYGYQPSPYRDLHRNCIQ